MVILISGATHTGKTRLAQVLLEKLKYPYLSIDHIKMGLIRSGVCGLTPESSDEELTSYLWPVIAEIIKTNIENGQNIIIEGCYIPFDWKIYFEKSYLEQIRYLCLIFTEKYILNNYDAIKSHESIIEDRIDDGYCTKELLIEDNSKYYNQCVRYGLEHILIDDKYFDDEEVLQKIMRTL